MVKLVSYSDVFFIAEYTQKMLNAMPDTIEEINLCGDILYSYYITNPSISDTATPVLTYDDYNIYREKLLTMVNKTDNELTNEEYIQKHSAMAFNKSFRDYYSKYKRIKYYHVNHYGITIDLRIFKHLRSFHIYQINCRSIVNIPPTVEWMSCNMCNVNKISKLPKILKTLSCPDNLMKRLPALHTTSIISLFCSGNKITRIPKLPDTVNSLHCYDNTISELPNPLPKSLQFLSCSDNNIDYLPNLPSTLIGLYIETNFIHEIPPLPKTLTDLFFGHNLVAKMPELPVFLKRITCYNNPIQEFVPFPPSVISANIEGTVMEV
jgi:hypothetical protein